MKDHGARRPRRPGTAQSDASNRSLPTDSAASCRFALGQSIALPVSKAVRSLRHGGELPVHALLIALCVLGWIGSLTGRLWLTNARRQRVGAHQRAHDLAARPTTVPRVDDGYFFAGSPPSSNGPVPVLVPAPTASDNPSTEHRTWSSRNPILDALAWATGAAILAGAVIVTFNALGLKVAPGTVLKVTFIAATLTVVLVRRREGQRAPVDETSGGEFARDGER
jgi:hypothetical protein